MKTFIFILSQYLAPQYLLSRIAGTIAECKIHWFKNTLIQWFINKYKVDMSIALESDPTHYQHFNDFFTRALVTDARPINQEQNSIICPADGTISQLGNINNGRIFQAKGQEYSLLELIGGDNSVAKVFQNGIFSTVYLSPKDYHRVHMPLSGTLQQMIHIPGDLFSVNDATAQHVPRLFARNERVICLFSTEVGPMAVILVGAMIVASIETVWAGLVTPVNKEIRRWNYSDQEPITLNKGDELGRFKLGSTAIVLMGKDSAQWNNELKHSSAVQMGQMMGSIEPKQ